MRGRDCRFSSPLPVCALICTDAGVTGSSPVDPASLLSLKVCSSACTPGPSEKIVLFSVA